MTTISHDSLPKGTVALTAYALWALLACAACSNESDVTLLRTEPGPAAPLKPAPEELEPQKSTQTPTELEPEPLEPKPEKPTPEEPEPSVPPTLRSAVTLDDLALGREVLALLGGEGDESEGRCSACHSITRPTLSLWAALTRSFSSACLEDTTLDSQAKVDQSYRCLLEHATEKQWGPIEQIDFEIFPEARPSLYQVYPRSVGIYAAALHLPWFSYLLENTSEREEEAELVRERLIEQAGMPRAGEPLTQAEFNRVAEWFERDVPGLLELVPEDLGEPCVSALDPALTGELTELANTGWRAKNLETPLLMFGCAPGQSGSACLTDLPNASDDPAGAGWATAAPGSTVRVLYDNTPNGRTDFWSRSSADGRYIASGGPLVGDFGGQIIDLSRGRRILADFFYDPTFFPDNSGFLVQGTSSEAGDERWTMLCNQSVLDGRFETITDERAGCARPEHGIGLYQQLASSLDGGDAWVVNGLFESDEPNFGPQLRNPYAPFDADTTLEFTPVINLGNSFEAGEAISVPTPFQGDPALSPSGRLLVTRSKGAEVFSNEYSYPTIRPTQGGYSFYRVNTTRSGNARTVSLERAGQLCLQGGKATFSFDERWLVIYRYITAADAVELGFEGPQDPRFAKYAERGGSNLYLFDLKSGQTTRITHMAPGQYALYPHFRSDGWIYFVVRDSGRTESAPTERFVATDAALRLEEAEARQ